MTRNILRNDVDYSAHTSVLHYVIDQSVGHKQPMRIGGRARRITWALRDVEPRL